jgi:hypothetical protein
MRVRNHFDPAERAVTVFLQNTSELHHVTYNYGMFHNLLALEANSLER